MSHGQQSLDVEYKLNSWAHLCLWLAKHVQEPFTGAHSTRERIYGRGGQSVIFQIFLDNTHAPGWLRLMGFGVKWYLETYSLLIPDLSFQKWIKRHWTQGLLNEGRERNKTISIHISQRLGLLIWLITRLSRNHRALFDVIRLSWGDGEGMESQNTFQNICMQCNIHVIKQLYYTTGCENRLITM